MTLRSRSQDQNTDFSANPQGNANLGEINSPPPGIMSNPDLNCQGPPQMVLEKMSENENLEKNAFSQGFSAEENSELILEPKNVSLNRRQSRSSQQEKYPLFGNRNLTGSAQNTPPSIVGF